MIPAKTHARIGRGQAEQARSQCNADDMFAISGNDLNDLYALAVRFNGRMEDGEELRDWQNRLNLMIHDARQWKLG
jgi:hypothetical protein